MQMFQKGRSMIEMLGVLAIIGVLSIGGLLGYRRAVNNHQANVILDDVNRFAFVILERSGLALDAEIDKGDFKESGIYNLKGYQSEEAQGFSITVQNVPKGVCEALLPKAVLEYKVGIVTAGGSVNDEVIYDTLNTDLCKDTNDIAFYFGDTSGVCNEPDESGYTPCTTNADCCGEYFCWYPQYPTYSDCSPGLGQCKQVSVYAYATGAERMSDGKTWTRSLGGINWWGAQNWCAAQGLNPAKRADIDCVWTDNYGEGECSSDTIKAIHEKWSNSGWYWLEGVTSSCGAKVTNNNSIGYNSREMLSARALCH